MNRTFIFAIPLILLTGCVSIQPVDNGLSQHQENIRDKNYKVGVMQTAYVGEQVIRVKSFDATINKFKSFKSDENIQFNGGPVHILIASGEELPIVGQKIIDHETYFIAQKGSFGIQISQDGTPYKKIINGIGGPSVVQMFYNFTESPPGAKFIPVESTSIVKNASNENYEIVFNGIDNQAIHFQYREYTADDMARPAFSQDLSYPISSKTIRFRNIEIQVENVSGEKIVFTVTDDHAER